MSKPFTMIAGLVLWAAAAAHAYRLWSGDVHITIAGQAVPMWVSWPALVIALFLGLMVFVEAGRR